MNLEDLTYEYLRSFEAELKAKAREDIARNKRMAIIFFAVSFLLPCGFMFCVVRYNLTISAGYFPIGVVELVFVGSGILFHTNMKQWKDYYERNFGKENVVREGSKKITNSKQVIQEEDNMSKDESQYRKDAREVLSETRWTLWKVLPTLLFAAVIIMSLGWFFQGNEFFMYKFFAPKQEQVRHDVFKNTQPYTDGKVQELQQYMLEYYKAEPEHKAALKTVIIRESAKVDEKYLPSDVSSFIHGLKSEETRSTLNFK